MSVRISGALTDGAGIPMSGCHIILKSQLNTSAVIMRTTADVITGNHGEYSFDAQTGKYSVYLKQRFGDRYEYHVGDIAVYADSVPGTLNDFLLALNEGDLKPDVVKRFEELAAQAQQSAEAAAGSELRAGQHAASAEQSGKHAEMLAAQAQQSADAAAGSAQRTEQLAGEVALDAGRVQQGVKDASEAAEAARGAAEKSALSAVKSEACAESSAQSEQNALRYAQQAGQHEQGARKYAQDAENAAASAENAKGEIDEILEGGYLKINNNLQEIVDAGPSALGKAQQNLQISGVKNKRVISTHYTWPSKAGYEQREYLSLAGAYGFGYTYEDKSQGRISFNKSYSASWWSNFVNPGRYYVTTSDKEYLTPDGGGYGIIDALWLNGNGESDASRVLKILAFYDGDGYLHIGRRYSQSDSSISWRKLASLTDVRAMLHSYIHNNYNREWRDPELGGLILASYQGAADGDTKIKVPRGEMYPGSRLAPVAIECQFTPSGTYAATPRFHITGCKSHSLPGTYISLSGAPAICSNQAFVALFMRIV